MPVSTLCSRFYQFGRKVMLVICEDCSKKYNVDESKIKGTRARFSCQECGHIIVVVKKSGMDQDLEVERLSFDVKSKTP
jgi:predicted Zn finger-like uncharacterized protein